MYQKIAILLVCLAILFFLILSFATEVKSSAFLPLTQNTSNALTSKLENQKISFPSAQIFSYSKIPSNILEKMIGNSIPEKQNVDITTLSYLRITYWGFDEETHIGEMIVHKDLAQEVLDIFQEVYEQKYPIEKMKLIDEYDAKDEKSMAANNTSAFCYRVVANTKKMSKHSLGKAIDINPLYNPYITKNQIMPAGSKQYIDRTLLPKGMIQKGDALYTAFTKRGWIWGGDWSVQKDYQHFEKK